MKFIVDINAGKLAKLLRMLGYDALLFNDADDNSLISWALSQKRIILTKDHEFLRRRLVTSGRLKVLHLKSDTADEQLKEVIKAFNLDTSSRTFSLCLECNQPLVFRNKEELEGRVPPYVYKTQNEFMECPTCHRLYWRGTHWQHMTQRLKGLK